MADEFSIGIKRSGSETSWLFFVGEVCVGDEPVHEYIGADQSVSIKMDRQEADALLAWLQEELGR